MLACIGESASLNDRCSPKPKLATLRQKVTRPGSARTPSSTSACSAQELDQRVTDLLTKFNVVAPTPLASSHTGSDFGQRRRPQSARACLGPRLEEVANSRHEDTSSCSTKQGSQLKRRPQSAVAHSSSASKASSRQKRPQSVASCDTRLADKDVLTVEDAEKILAVLLDAKQRQQERACPMQAPEQAQSSHYGSHISTLNESRIKDIALLSKSCTSSHGVSESIRASTQRSSDVSAALHRLPREWIESVRSSYAKSQKSQSYRSCGEASSAKTPHPQSNLNIDALLEDLGAAGSPTTQLTPALWHLQIGPERALWGRHKKACTHGSYLFETGAWAKRMGNGTGSITQYKQWGPAGPQFAIDRPKHHRR